MSEPTPENFLSLEWGWDNVRFNVFQLLAWGYEIVESEIRQKHKEEDITGLLRKGIREKLDNPSLPEYFRSYTPGNEDPVDDTGKYGSSRPKIDIMFECSGGLPRLRYCFEAKRCHRRRYKMDWYSQGIQAFINRQYAKGATEGAMLGLVQSGTTAYWKSGLIAETAQNTALCCETSPTDVTDLVLPDMTASIHRRNDGSLITLYHVFLDCVQP